VDNVPCILKNIDTDQGYEFLALPKDGVQQSFDNIHDFSLAFKQAQMKPIMKYHCIFPTKCVAAFSNCNTSIN
jgi:hypothetical protein